MKDNYIRMFHYWCLKNLLIYILIFCVVEAVNNSSTCSWEKVKSGINAEEAVGQNWKSLGYAIDADHCGTLCMMNQPMFSPQPCNAYAYSFDVPWGGPKHNCYMYTSTVYSTSFTSTGSFDFYKQTCSSNPMSASLSNEGCCNPLYQNLTAATTVVDGRMTFSYDSSTCRKAATVTYTDLNNKYRLLTIVVNEAFHVQVGKNASVSSTATCKNGKWEISDPALTIESLECRLAMPI